MCLGIECCCRMHGACSCVFRESQRHGPTVRMKMASSTVRMKMAEDGMCDKTMGAFHDCEQCTVQVVHCAFTF